MLFATYGAPPNQPRQTNPLLIVLGVCGGCALLVVIGFVALGVWGVNATKGLMGGAIQMPQTAKSFVTALEGHNYAKCASLVDPTAQSTLTADKIKSMEEQVESKLGPIQTSNFSPTSPMTNTIPGPSGKPQYIEYIYQVPLQYKKGSGTLTLRFRSADLGNGQDISKMKLSGKVTGMKIQPDSGSSSGQ